MPRLNSQVLRVLEIPVAHPLKIAALDTFQGLLFLRGWTSLSQSMVALGGQNLFARDVRPINGGLFAYDPQVQARFQLLG